MLLCYFIKKSIIDKTIYERNTYIYLDNETLANNMRKAGLIWIIYKNENITETI